MGPMPFMYLEKSRMTAVLQPWPAREVPAPRERRGALTARQAETGAMTSASSRGMTTPMGMWRELEPSVAERACGGAELLFEGVGLGEGVVYASVGARQKDEGGGGHNAHCSPKAVRLF